MLLRLFALLMCLLVPLAGAGDQMLRLATSTSTAHSGLLDVLIPAFEQVTGYRTVVLPVGTGTALRLAREGKADALLVHAPKAEQRFVLEGHGLARREVMYNDFIIVGPSNDPAGLAGGRDIRTALRRVWDRRAEFVSRGDDSGTHKKELALWQQAGLDPYGQRWYLELGAGVAQVLRAASDSQAYTLADRGSWLALKETLKLRLLVAGDPLLANPYGAIAVNPQRHANINAAAADAFIAWIASTPAQRLIRDYRVNGEQLFVPSLLVE